MDDASTKPKPTKIIDDSVGTMERVLGETKFDPDAKKPTVFNMRSPIPKQGNDRNYMAVTDRMWVFVNTYGPKSGKNQIHTHQRRSHLHRPPGHRQVLRAQR
jgi:hypothetical protein